jgi:putative tryptophan/tyrosine transport system substrate-binding protein
MRRRQFIVLLSGAAAGWPLAARAQQPERMRRVGVLLAAYTQSDGAGQARIDAFRKGLQGLGWTNDRNVRCDYRWGDGSANRGKALAAELVQSAPDAIVVAGDPALTELQRLTKAIPIIFTQVSDPVDSGFVASLARPGGNITGFQNFEPEIGGKWLGVLLEAAPRLRRFGALVIPGTAPHVVFLHAAGVAAASLGVALMVANVQDIGEIERAIAAFGSEPDTGLIVFPHPLTIANRALIYSLAARHRLPAIYPYKYLATDGGLLSYGPDQVDQWHGAATYVDRILRGERPSDLPVQAPTKYETVINLRTAKALGLNIPPTLLATADEVIE